MVNADILQAFLWHISLYSHSLEDIDTEENNIRRMLKKREKEQDYTVLERECQLELDVM